MSQVQERGAPEFTLKVAGAELSAADAIHILRVEVEDHVDKLSVAQVEVEGQAEQWSWAKVGEDLEIRIGRERKPLFKGLITGWRVRMRAGAATLALVAMDPMCKLTTVRRTRTFEDVTDTDVAKQLFSGASLSAGRVDSTSTKHKHVLQRNESDLELLKRLAARNGFQAFFQDGKANFSKPVLPSAIDVDGSEVLEIDYTVDVLQVPPSIKVFGWDHVKLETFEGTADAGAVLGIGSGKKAPEVAKAVLNGESAISDVDVRNQSDARDVARAEMARAARTLLRGRATLFGDRAVVAATRLAFKDLLREGFDPTVYVVSSRHVVSDLGYQTHVHFVSDTLP